MARDNEPDPRDHNGQPNGHANGNGHRDGDVWEAEVYDLNQARVRRASGQDTGTDLVDGAEAQRSARPDMSGWKVSDRRPIVPPWLRSIREARDTARWAVGHVLHTSTYHATRSPKYAAKLTFRSPRGAIRTVRASARWVFDLEGEQVRQATARREDAETYLKLARHRDRRVRWRGIAALLVLPLLAAGGVLVAFAPSWAQWTALGLVVAMLGKLGAPEDKPLLDTAVVKPKVAKLTSTVVIEALRALGLAGMNQALAKNPKAISFVAPITRDGPGWRADIDLPPGVTAAEVIDRRDKLAAGLGRPLGCAWPEGRHEIHPGRLVLWVGDQDVATVKQPAWPYAKTGTVDLFKAFPFGTDPRGRPVMVELVESNVLMGSIPGAGKTSALRVPLLAAALDPRAELWTFELKGTGDLEPLAKVSARYGSGADDDDVELALQALRDLRKECSKRSKTISGLPKEVCPANKVTPELANRRSLGLHPLVVAIDECQELFSHPTYGKEAGELAEKVIKLGRALGVVLLLATQRPDKDSLPTGISANVGTRFCLRVMGQVENDMILGTSQYKNGVRATMFTRRDRGVGYLVGAGDDPQIVRAFYLDGPAADRITDRARAARVAAGTLSGHATGEETPTSIERADTLLDDILTICPPSEGNGKFWSEVVAERLAAHNPDAYADLSRDQLTAALRRHGIATRQVWGTAPDGTGANRRGIDTEHVAQVVADRNRRRGGTPST